MRRYISRRSASSGRDLSANPSPNCTAAPGLVGDDSRYTLDLEALRTLARDHAEVEVPMDPAIGFGMIDHRK